MCLQEVRAKAKKTDYKKQASKEVYTLVDSVEIVIKYVSHANMYLPVLTAEMIPRENS